MYVHTHPCHLNCRMLGLLQRNVILSYSFCIGLLVTTSRRRPNRLVCFEKDLPLFREKTKIPKKRDIPPK